MHITSAQPKLNQWMKADIYDAQKTWTQNMCMLTLPDALSDSNALSQDKSTETFTQQYSPRTAYRSVWAEQLSYTPWHSQVLSPWNKQHDILDFKSLKQTAWHSRVLSPSNRQHDTPRFQLNSWKTAWHSQVVSSHWNRQHDIFRSFRVTETDSMTFSGFKARKRTAWRSQN